MDTNERIKLHDEECATKGALSPYNQEGIATVIGAYGTY